LGIGMLNLYFVILKFQVDLFRMKIATNV
jgi:hypothetical protein